MKVKRFLMSLIVVFFPWVALLIYDNPGGALVALLLQATVVGWIPASMWAWRTVNDQGKPSPDENTGT